ncbi:iron(III) ABC transporter, permease protein [Colwellia psychrerythraea 34H]|uniref:Iron(III) ABC transporter, permease protein n=1 Tax=Colwellia psychrerythraea (strain 34H / ATCC BAA-681) TaxID=167879 RepID=Q487K3_COLP3|nr:iron(III) ABC transporter, permease protein [Colwellia psychrerythraea 34H]
MIALYNSRTWKLSSYIIALVLIVPVVVMLVGGVSASTQLFVHLWQTVLPSYLENTLLLAFWVVLLALVFGVFSAAIITQTNIVFKQQLRWLLLLPLAMPAYLVAYLYTDLFDYAGPVQRALRGWFDWQSPNDYWFFDIRTLPGAALMLALVLFPYIYMLTRGAFEQQDQNLIRASRLLGLTAKQSFFKVALPLARPAIAVSASLVLMETLADFATVQYFSVNTLTTAIYDTWLGYGDLGAANALASILMLLVLFVVLAEQRSRAGLRHQSARPNSKRELIQLSFSQQLIASIFCWALVILGFLLPITLLIIMAVQYSDFAQLSALLSTGINSLKVSVFAATIAVVIALSLGLYQRLHNDKYRQVPQLISGFGYAVPGTVLAMAMLSTLGPLDHWINDAAEFIGFGAPGLILSGSLFAIVFALVVRFSAIANGTITSGIKQIPRSLDYAPATLGVNLRGSLTKVHLPILTPAILVAWLLVFVEAMKELPAVLLLRPFNFETLSSQIYQLISDEVLEQGALGAILIVLFGLLPIVLLNKSKEKV